jgi:phosphate transport system ATP-binding protein
VVLIDDPASALDSVATSQIEEFVTEPAEEHTVVIVTHDMQQAACISNRTAVFHRGRARRVRRRREDFPEPREPERRGLHHRQVG